MPKLKERFDNVIEKATAGYSKVVNSVSLDRDSSSADLKCKSKSANANALMVALFLGSTICSLTLLSIAFSGVSTISMLAKSLVDMVFDLTSYLSWFIVPVAAIYAAKPFLEHKMAVRREQNKISSPADLVRQTASVADTGLGISYPIVPTLTSQPVEALENNSPVLVDDVTPPGSPMQLLRKPRVIY